MPVRVAPSMETLRSNGVRGTIRGWNIIVIRIRPYPPSFRRILARIMEPAVGASTWALGSHRWRE